MTEGEHSASLSTALIARRYYLDGATKNQIATEFGISRFRIARILDDALARGIVRISIDTPAGIDVDLGARLSAATGLRQAIVVVSPPASSAGETRASPELSAALGAAAATLLTETLESSDVLGLTWGSTLSAVVEHLGPLPAVQAVQLAGSLSRTALRHGAPDLLRRIQERTHGQVFALHAPLLLGSAIAAQALREDPQLRETSGRFGDLTHAIVGIGSWGEGSSALVQELGAADRSSLIAAGAVADIGSSVFDRHGAPVCAEELASRSVGITAEELAAVNDVIAVAGGREKATAILAALRSGILDRLITDQEAARAILAVYESAPNEGDPRAEPLH